MNLTTQTMTAADGTRLQVRHSVVDCNRTTCVLIHGSGEGHFVWHDLLADLARAPQVVLMDLRGHGDSQASLSGRYDLDTHVDDVALIVRELRLQQLILIGHSLGGLIAIRLAAQALRDQVCAAMVVDISSEPNPHCMQHVAAQIRDNMRPFASVGEYAEVLLDTRPLLSQTTALALAQGALRACESGFELKLDHRYFGATRAVKEYISAAECDRLLRMMSCPTVVVRGACSAMVSAESAASMVQALARGTLVTVPLAGHAVMSDNPQAFASVANQFLTRWLGTGQSARQKAREQWRRLQA